jgi:hypothetical protein
VRARCPGFLHELRAIGVSGVATLAEAVERGVCDDVLTRLTDQPPKGTIDIVKYWPIDDLERDGTIRLAT